MAEPDQGEPGSLRHGSWVWEEEAAGVEQGRGLLRFAASARVPKEQSKAQLLGSLS